MGGGGGVKVLPMWMLVPVVIAWESWRDSEVGVPGRDMERGGAGKRPKEPCLRRRGVFVPEVGSLRDVEMVSCSAIGSLGGRKSDSGTGFREIDLERLVPSTTLGLTGGSSPFSESIIAAVSANGF